MARFGIAQVTTAPDSGALLMLLYSDAKFGKTTLLCEVEGLFLVCPELGLKGIAKPAPHFTTEPRNLDELYEALEAFVVLNAKVNGVRPYKYLAIDTVTWVQTMIHAAARKSNGENLTEDYQRGMGTVDALWDRFLMFVSDLRRRAGVHVWLVAHAARRQESNAGGDVWMKWDVDLDKKAAGKVRKIVDHVFFGGSRTSVPKAKKGKRQVGIDQGRFLFTRDCPDHFAGCRGSFPEVIPFTWPDLRRALTSGKPAPEQRLRDMLKEALSRLGPDERALIEADLTGAKTERELAGVLSRAEALVEIAGQDEPDDQEPVQGAGEPPEGPPPADEEEEPEDAPPIAPQATAKAPAETQAQGATQSPASRGAADPRAAALATQAKALANAIAIADTWKEIEAGLAEARKALAGPGQSFLGPVEAAFTQRVVASLKALPGDAAAMAAWGRAQIEHPGLIAKVTALTRG